MNRIICGVYVSKDWLDAHVWPGGAAARFANDAAGIAALWLFCRSHGAALAVMEASGGYERLGFMLLWAHGMPCGVVNAKSVRRFAEAMGYLEKTDRIEAAVIAHYGVVKNTVATPPPSAAQQRLAALVGWLCQIVGDATINKQRRSAARDAEVCASVEAMLAFLKREQRHLDGEIASMIDDDPLWARLERTFRSIWLATQVSSLGWLMQTVAISWLMATISNSDLMVALVQATSNLPAFILSVFAGALAGNFSRRRVMFAGLCPMVIASADRCCGARLCQSVDDPRLQLPDRMRGCSPQSRLAGLGWRYHGPTRCSCCRDLALRRLQYCTDSGPGTRRHHGCIVWAFSSFAVTTLTYLVPLGIWRCKWKVRSSPLPRESMRTAIHDGLRFTAISSEIGGKHPSLALLPLVVRDQPGGGPLA
ncbi:transmembrane secretion effector [Mesorhizobium loti]|uniref:Transmembrane secretion effector n=1 Tax=Rhizobium loti TaxID=381 RepID=A0A8E3B298_RHILI|nr:transmembrane secretion effector [Mesorhizobium loti]